MTLKRASGGSNVDISTTFERKLSGANVPVDLVRRASGGSWTVVWSRINCSDTDATSSRFTGTATAAYEVHADGTVYTTTGTNTLGLLENWLSFGTASNYEVKATLLGGATPTGTLGSWLALSSNRAWTLSQSLVGDTTCTLLIEIRNALSLAVVDTATVTIYAERI